ncbi:hypothetical protein IQ07DRAFT_104452 [Pyrenochaeta sp. DS3sAY3a]|nr:hypothetical protein IQ07DRAFT_104452 [Pyrenochaeta sp. DS3sAY3a]
MHFSTIAIASLFSLATAAPTANEKRFPSPGSFITPSAISIFHVSNGAIAYNSDKAEVSRINGQDTTTLVTFDLNARAPPAGATCYIKFYHDASDTYATFSGYGSPAQIDIFRSLQPAPSTSTSGWGPGNQRDTFQGRLEPVYKSSANDGFAKVVENVFPKTSAGFPCPQVGEYRVKGGLVGFEVVPTGTSSSVQWTKDLSGLILAW